MQLQDVTDSSFFLNIIKKKYFKGPDWKNAVPGLKKSKCKKSSQEFHTF